MDLDAVADELYGLPPEDFTATRNERAKQARAAGERQLATAIQQLRKPTQAAWLLNQLVRSHAEETQLLLDLGAELRDVLTDVGGAELRELTRQRHRLVSALVQQTRSIGQVHGRRVTDDVAQAVRTTLEATLSNQSSADALAAGRLTEPLEVSSGFSVDRDSSDPPARAQPSPAPGTVTDLTEERRRRDRQAAEAQVDDANRRVDSSRTAVESAAEQLRSVQRRAAEAIATVDRLRDELGVAEAAAAQLTEQEEAARETLDEAAAELQEAEREVAEAEQRLTELS